MSKERDPMGATAWWGRVDACRKVRKEYFKTWQDNVSYRRGKPFKGTPNEDVVNVPADWSRTKNKVAQLFYQMPEVLLKARRPEWAPATLVFGAALNFELTEKIHAEHMMNECLADVVNASGLMVCMVSYEAEFEDVPMSVGEEEGEELGGQANPMSQLPMGMAGEGGVGTGVGAGVGTSGSQSPDVSVQGIEAGEAVNPVQGEVMTSPETMMLPRPIYECYKTERVSPAHFVWPIEFVGSDWQRAAFLGREGMLPVAEAIRRGWVPAGTEGVEITDPEWLMIQEFSDVKPADSFIKYVEIFTHPHYYDPNEKDPNKIRRIVLVESGGGKDGKESRAKVVDEDFKWQKKDPQTGRWVGMTTYPLKVGTIAHISDLAIPPSDSEIARPQVKELIKSRTQIIRQRDHSQPLRWFDVNQVDPIIGDRLRRGKWQDMIPMNGPGDHAIGEVARANYPAENWNFDKTIKNDLDESWSMGANQQGLNASGETTATEVKEIKGANDIRLDFERQWVVRFFLEVAQSVGQLMQLFSDDEDYAYVVGEDGKATLQQWNKDKIQGEYVFSIRPDSQLRLDVQQRRNEGLNLYKLLRKDPIIDPAVLVRRVLEDHGMDPSKAFAKPQPPKVEKPKISGSFKGEDMANPIALALINKSDTPITAEDITAAQKLIQTVMATAPTPQPTPGSEMAPPNQEHPGPAPVVQPLNRRYEKAETGTEGSRDSSLPSGK